MLDTAKAGEASVIAVDTLAFGRTGHRSSRVIFGAAALGAMRQEKADQVLELLLASGVNHIDTAASYGDSELRVGAWMERHRDRFFLATKTGDRTADGARASLQRSLERLRVRAGRPDPAAQPGRRARVGDGARSRRRARGAGGGARPRAGALHRRHRARHASPPRCTAAASSASRSTPSWCRTTSPCCTPRSTRPTSKRCSRAVASAASRCRRSSRWRGAAGRARRERRFSWYEPLRDRGRDPARGALRARAAGALPQLVERRDVARAHPRRRVGAVRAARGCGARRGRRALRDRAALRPRRVGHALTAAICARPGGPRSPRPPGDRGVRAPTGRRAAPRRRS